MACGSRPAQDVGEEVLMPDEELIRAAEAVRANAYAPYSCLKVGAALRAEDGRVYVGANVENASYPEGLCAEAAAIAAMVAAGGRRIVAMAVSVEGAAPAPPCGGCRQRMAEFADPATPIDLAASAGARVTVTLGEILPGAFTARHLPHP
jgi:cytidine deaminase